MAEPSQKNVVKQIADTLPVKVKEVDPFVKEVDPFVKPLSHKKPSPFWFGFRQGLTAIGRVYSNNWPVYPGEDQTQAQAGQTRTADE